MKRECERAKLSREIKEHLSELEMIEFIDGVISITSEPLNRLVNGQKLILEKLNQLEEQLYKISS